MAHLPNVIVIGAGPVGAACALALAKQHCAVTLIDRANFLHAQPQDEADKECDHCEFDHRVYALSPASKQLLDDLGVWPRIAQHRITPVDRMHVFSDAEEGTALPELRFDAGEPVAWMVEHRALVHSLVVRVREANLRCIDGVGIDTHAWSGDKRTVTLSDGQQLTCDLLIGADGRQSVVRSLAGIAVRDKDYASDALVANFRCERPHGNTAYQWFSSNSVLAYLPLPNQQMSIVWSETQEQCAAHRTLSADALCAAVARAGHHALGKLTLASPVEHVPLKRVLATECVQPALALVGDAAHAIHPLAGQGANLGFGDVVALVHALASRSKLTHIGDIKVLRRYARARAEATVAMAETTDHLQGLFVRSDNVSKWIRRQGFTAFGKVPLLKHAATQHAMRG